MHSAATAILPRRRLQLVSHADCAPNIQKLSLCHILTPRGILTKWFGLCTNFDNVRKALESRNGQYWVHKLNWLSLLSSNNILSSAGLHLDIVTILIRLCSSFTPLVQPTNTRIDAQQPSYGRPEELTNLTMPACRYLTKDAKFVIASILLS